MSFNDAEVSIPIGKKLFYGDAANAITNEIFGTTKITLPERETGKTEYTNDSSSGEDKTKRYKSALHEPGTAKASYVYQITQFAALEEVAISGETKYFKVLHPDGTTFIFQGFITKHVMGELGMEEVPEIDLEIQVSGTMATTPPTGT